MHSVRERPCLIRGLLAVMLAGVLAVALCTMAAAQQDDSLAGPELGEIGLYDSLQEAAWDWHPGDLIFRNGMKTRDELIRDAEGGRWATVGILRAASGDPRVVYVDDRLGVTETMLDQFIDGLRDDDYAVYRVTKLDVNTVPGRQMQQDPISRYALFTAYEHEYDPLMQLGNGGFSNADLPWIAALNAGVRLGDPVTLDALVRGAGKVRRGQAMALREDLLRNWRDHPHCVVQSTKQDCWQMIKGFAVITPRVLIESPALTQVYPRRR